MRILLLADIHANWPALQAIHEPHDRCFVLGDLVDYGLDPAPCIEWVEQHAHTAIRGNHDHAAAQHAVTNGKNGFKYLSGITRQLTWDRVGGRHLRYLRGLPITRYVTVGETRFLLVHATPRDPLDEYAPNDPQLWARRLENVDADIICVGHTHSPYVLQVGNQTVINPGSVGQPRDGDPRASYAVWEDGRIEIRRAEYALAELLRAVEASPMPDLAKRMSIEVYRTGASAVHEHAKANGAPLRG